MAVPSGEYGEGEGGYEGGGAGLGIVIAVAVLVILMSKLTSEIKKAGNINRKPNTEIINNVDTFARAADTINIRTR